jgi:lipoprotein-anchoring transpeptidase ErfK/SrfK
VIGISARGAADQMSVAPSRRRGRLLVFSLVGAAVVLVLAVAMLLYDHSRRDVIANGVRIDGVSVGGMSESAARAKVQHELVAGLNVPVVVRSGGHRWRLTPRQVDLTVDAERMVAEALSASRSGSIFSRTFRSLFGGSVDHNVPLLVSYSHVPVHELTANVSGTVNRAPRDATVAPTATSLHPVPSLVGLTVEGARLDGRIDRALASTGAKRTVSVPVHQTRPAVTTSQLAARYPAYIVVARSEFRLRFFEHLKLAKTYEIAVGMEGLETPAGLHHIEWEQTDPPWYVPNKAWAGALAGTVVPPGPEDPLKARFMSFDGGAGIHGIDPSEYGTIGADASHGCIRMRIPDVIALYAKSPVGTPVYII